MGVFPRFFDVHGHAVNFIVKGIDHFAMLGIISGNWFSLPIYVPTTPNQHLNEFASPTWAVSGFILKTVVILIIIGFFTTGMERTCN